MTGTGERAVRQAATSPAVRTAGRLGLAAYGVVHLLMAGLAVQVAIGGASKADKSGALQTIASSTGGAVLLWLVAVGLTGLTVWQLAEAVWGEPRWRARAVHVSEAVLFGYLAYAAVKLVTSGDGPSDADQRMLTARLLGQPYGKYLVAAIGLAVVVAAGFVAHRGLTADFRRNLDLRTTSAGFRRLAVRLGQVGYTALAAVYGIAGALLVVAALRADPSKATGLDSALKALAAHEYGVTLLLLVAAGLAAFGVFALIDARYRRV